MPNKTASKSYSSFKVDLFLNWVFFLLLQKHQVVIVVEVVFFDGGFPQAL